MHPVGRILIIAGLVFGVLGCVGALFAYRAFVDYQDRSMEGVANESLAALERDLAYTLEQRESGDDCELPPSLPQTTGPSDCCGRHVCSSDPEALAEWESAGFKVLSAFDGNHYFAYEGERIDEGTYELRAEADFRCEEPNHKTIKRIDFDLDTCDIEGQPLVVKNEFQ